MLSEAIRELRRTLEEFDHSGVELNAEGVTAFSMMLRAFEIAAGDMEARLDGLSVGHHAAILPIGDNVVRFPARPS